MILIIGHPNAGKTTFSARFEHVLHLDDFPPNKFLNCNQAVAESGGDVVVDGIYNLRCRRLRLLEGCRGNSPKVCYLLDTPLDECIRREEQGRQRPGVMEHSYLEPPTLDEGWDEIRIIRDGNEEIIVAPS